VTWLKTELELRFIVDLSRPLTANERQLLDNLMAVLRAARTSHSLHAAGDIDVLQKHLEALPVTAAARAALESEAEAG
jgi:hypothetical protein